MGPGWSAASFADGERRNPGSRSSIDRLTLFCLMRLTAKEDGTTMNKRDLLAIGGAAALGLALIALPASSARPQRADDSKIARLQQQIEELQAKLQAELENRADQKVEFDDADRPVDSTPVLCIQQDPGQIEVHPKIEPAD